MTAAGRFTVLREQTRSLLSISSTLPIRWA
jgi:hypothetical protein